MRSFGSILLGLIRPGKGLDQAESATKWLWVPLAVILLGSVLLKTVIALPIQEAQMQEQLDVVMQEQLETMPEGERANYEKEMAAAEASGDFSQDQAVDAVASVTSVAGIVFGLLGATFALLYIATFFFVAAKTWANPVKFGTMLTVAGLSLLPHALRNVIQGVYMAGSGVFLQHSGLGALVAPTDVTQAPGMSYALLSQIDIFVLWGVALLFGALLSKTVGFEKRRAISATVAFVLVTAVLQAIPTIIAGMFAGGGGYI